MTFVGHKFKNDIQAQVPKIIISRQALEDQAIITDIATVEVGMLGAVEKLADGTLVVQRVYLIDQQVNAGTNEISTEGLGKLAVELGRNANPVIKADVNRLYYWFHSHHTMGVEPSGQDDTQVGLWKRNEAPFLIRAIGNKRGELKLDLFDFDKHYAVLDIEWAVEASSDSPRRAALQAEFDLKVKPLTWSGASQDWRRTSWSDGDDFKGYRPYKPWDEQEVPAWCSACRQEVTVERRQMFSMLTCPYKKKGCGVRAKMVPFTHLPSLGDTVAVIELEGTTSSTPVAPSGQEVLDHEEHFCGAPHHSPPAETSVSSRFNAKDTYPAVAEILEGAEQAPSTQVKPDPQAPRGP
jgi:hypothetical protein